MLCLAGTGMSGWLRPRASAKVTLTPSTHGDWKGAPPSLPRVAEVQCSYVLERRGGDTQHLGKAPRLQLARDTL